MLFYLFDALAGDGNEVTYFKLVEAFSRFVNYRYPLGCLRSMPSYLMFVGRFYMRSFVIQEARIGRAACRIGERQGCTRLSVMSQN